MEKKWFEILFKVIVITGLAIVIVLHFDKKKPIVYVDAIKLVNGYKGMKEARDQFDIKSKSWKMNLDTLKSELESKLDEYEVKKNKLNAREKASMEELIRVKQEQYVNYQNVISEKIQKEDQELSGKVLGKVNEYLKKYGQEKGYEIILAATQYGNIVYADKATDITDQVLEGLNRDVKN
jgi:outer membrane protein